MIDWIWTGFRNIFDLALVDALNIACTAIFPIARWARWRLGRSARPHILVLFMDFCREKASEPFDIKMIANERHQAAKEQAMVDILIRNVDKDTARRLKEKAAQKGASLSDTAREALTAFVRPGRKELIEQARRIRAMSRYSDVDSTDLIRADRQSR